MSPPLHAWSLGGAQLTPIDVGLINQSYEVQHEGRRYVLQKINPIFGAEVHVDIEAVTRHLDGKGMVTPLLVPTTAGESYLENGDEVWRLMTWIEGRTLTQLSKPSEARAAGSLLGRFHNACLDLKHDFVHVRVGVHDTAAHLAGLKNALLTHQDHRLFAPVQSLAESIFEAFDDMPDPALSVRRVAHGDPKISNLIFDADRDEARCLIDLDTLGRMPLVHEMGDAWRSWCNSASEDSEHPHFSVELFGAALEAWAPHVADWILPEEAKGLASATHLIATELAARFARDALEESYFGWDSEAFSHAGEHNLARARGQLALAEDVSQKTALLTAALKQAFG